MPNRLPCLDLLDATPAILRGLLSEIGDTEAMWKPRPERFSIAEVISHLRHSEWHCYGARLHRFLSEEQPELEPDDAQMHLDLYKNGNPAQDLQGFTDERQKNIAQLRTLPEDAGNRKARHKEAGEITLSHMLHEWALHDLGHIRQIAELVRATKYLAGAGPLGADYNLEH